jgi:hypothetical protein
MTHVGFPRIDSGLGAPGGGRRDRRRTALLSLAGFATLVFGIAIGVGGMVFHFRDAALGEGGNPRRIGEMLAASIAEEIPLTHEEDTRIRGIIADRVARIDDLRNDYDGKFQAEFDALCTEICAILGNDRSRVWEHCVHRDFGTKAAERIRANRRQPEPETLESL